MGAEGIGVRAEVLTDFVVIMCGKPTRVIELSRVPIFGRYVTCFPE